jgi:hypothetical protein
MRAFLTANGADFSGDGYYIIRPDMTSLDQIEWVDRDKPLQFQGDDGVYALIGNGCDIVERVEWAEKGFDVVKDPNMLVGWRADPRDNGRRVSVWLDEEGMYRQPPNPLAIAIAKRLGFIDVSHGLFGTMIVACGKAEVQ